MPKPTRGAVSVGQAAGPLTDPFPDIRKVLVVARILLIEDDPSAQLLYRNRLEDLGHEVVVADNGARGLMEASAGTFDIFLVDIGLGSGIDGYEVCRRLKARPQINSVPVVLVSGQVKGREELHLGYEVGCESFRVKGDLILLEDVVRAMLRIKALHDDLGLQNRLLEEQNKRLQQERQRAADLELALREAGGRGLVFRELAAGRPDGILLVDPDGVVRSADRGARDILGKELEGKHLARLAPDTGIEAFVRDARTEPREGYRFDFKTRAGRVIHQLSASVLPLVPRSGSTESAMRVVLVLDAGKRRVAAEMLRLEEHGVPRRELGPLLEAARRYFHPSGILGESAAIRALRSQVMSVCSTDSPVLIRGESGTGKGLIARTLHFSGLGSGPFVPVNCRAVDPTLLESELFGHVKGAFPESLSDRPGLFQQANHGTLFLNRVDRVPLALQGKILRALQDGEAYRVGSQNAEHVDLRIIAASEVDLEVLVEKGEFDKDLFYRLNVVDIQIPPLRERESDVRILALEFLKRYGLAKARIEFSIEALRTMEQHDWPGNVRELENCVERACAMVTGTTILVSHLPQHLQDLYAPEIQDKFIPSIAAHGSLSDAALRSISGGRGSKVQPSKTWEMSFHEDDEPVSLEWYEKLCLLRALRETRGDKQKAAKKLGIGKSTFYRKLSAHGI